MNTLIKLHKRLFIKKRPCQQCCKLCHLMWKRQTPNTTCYYCEGCASERGIVR